MQGHIVAFIKSKLGKVKGCLHIPQHLTACHQLWTEFAFALTLLPHTCVFSIPVTKHLFAPSFLTHQLCWLLCSFLFMDSLLS